MISGIRWVSELVEIAGGEDVFSELSRSQAATGRIVAGPRGRWSRRTRGHPRLLVRQEIPAGAGGGAAGWEAIPAVRSEQLFEIKSADILQPGPAALTDGVRQHPRDSQAVFRPRFWNSLASRRREFAPHAVALVRQDPDPAAQHHAPELPALDAEDLEVAEDAAAPNFGSARSAAPTSRIACERRLDVRVAGHADVDRWRRRELRVRLTTTLISPFGTKCT